MIKILKDHGIEMEVNACGCCNSPYVKFKHDGQTIVDGDGMNFNTESKDDDKSL